MQRQDEVQVSFLEKVSPRGQLEATLQARETFSSQCKLSRKHVGGRANLDRPLVSVPRGDARPVLHLELSTSVGETKGGEKGASLKVAHHHPGSSTGLERCCEHGDRPKVRPHGSGGLAVKFPDACLPSPGWPLRRIGALPGEALVALN